MAVVVIGTMAFIIVEIMSKKNLLKMTSQENLKTKENLTIRGVS